jgi:hypothetical protein
VDDVDLERGTGWSVLVQGVGQEITGAIDAWSERLRALALEPWAPGDRGQWVRILPDRITGRRLRAR